MEKSEEGMLREKGEEATLGERKPFESSRQATYEDTVRREGNSDRVWDEEDA